ncbi:hypothetical protein BBO_00330 [Beauveria brongniartii RCEF 3172]|uniref:Uncharacterized protein n=1 Tax=Beauveria brongniartii RCEF 3172 TaxID=1081107 RepID=A0A167L1B3_9HYPO|nr:hypothetical protein BBO_00330 [Beauveria brongniartii RCEF 3172]
MAGSSQKQGHTTADGSANSAAGHKTPNPAATTAQAPASTGGQHAQEQAVPDDQVSDGFTDTEESVQHSSAGARPRRQPSDATSQLVFLSDTNAEEGSSQDREPSFGEEISNASWVMQRFWAGQDHVPIWARPVHTSERAASAHGRARVLPIIADIENYIPPFQ